MAVPNHRHVVEDVYATGDYDLTTHDGQAAFVDDVVVALHATDPRWGHLKKSGGQTNIHGHAEDAALYLSDTPGQSQAVDFIAGAGGPNPTVGWGVDTPRYSRSDWYPPDEHPPVNPPDPYPEPEPVQPYPDEVTWWEAVFDVEAARIYALKGLTYPSPRSARWSNRTAYDIRDGLTKEASMDKHLKELKAELGLPEGA